MRGSVEWRPNDRSATLQLVCASESVVRHLTLLPFAYCYIAKPNFSLAIIDHSRVQSCALDHRAICSGFRLFVLCAGAVSPQL